MNIDEFEKTIAGLRTQAAQLEATAVTLENMIAPIKHLQKFSDQGNHLMQQWMKVWFNSSK